MGEDNDPDGHHEQRRCLARDLRRAAGEFLVQEEPAQPDGADRVGDRDHGQDRREHVARLEGVLVEHEADRADDGDGVDWPVSEQIGKSAAEFGGRELDREVRDRVGGTAGKGKRERPRCPVQPGQRQAACQHRGEPGQQRQRFDEADRLPPGRRPGDDKESGDAGRASDDSRAGDRVRVFSQDCADQAGECMSNTRIGSTRASGPNRSATTCRAKLATFAAIPASHSGCLIRSSSSSGDNARRRLTRLVLSCSVTAVIRTPARSQRPPLRRSAGTMIRPSARPGCSQGGIVAVTAGRRTTIRQESFVLLPWLVPLGRRWAAAAAHCLVPETPAAPCARPEIRRPARFWPGRRNAGVRAKHGRSG